jgi:hypothetical protein
MEKKVKIDQVRPGIYKEPVSGNFLVIVRVRGVVPIGRSIAAITDRS